jgi:hypothetical protein
MNYMERFSNAEKSTDHPVDGSIAIIACRAFVASVKSLKSNE